MDDFDPHQLHLRRALRQRLQSLQAAGVEQLCKPAQVNVAQNGVPGEDHNGPRSSPARATVSSDNAGSPVPRPLLTPESMMSVPPPSTPRTRRLKLSEKKAQLESLCESVKSCERCAELVANRTQTVFGVGSPQTRLCFFGEAPGADEDRLGEPFVGRAGQLLDKIIEACTLSRHDVYILNTVKCRPPGNRNPSSDEIDSCRPFFEQQLEIIRPEFICCLGSVAATALLDTKLAVGKLRGELHPWRWARVLVTYHPAYLLRNPPAKRLVWDDMQLLMQEMGIER